MGLPGKLFQLQVRPKIPLGLERLSELAEDLWFSWNSKARALFFQIDPVLWTMTSHNPRLFLNRVSQKRLEEMAKDRSFLSLYNGVMSDYDSYQEVDNLWYRQNCDSTLDYHFAYFSAEFGLHESLPVYSGGLGILAGDHCKSASDLGLPFTAVGLLYRHGYFTQTIDRHGNQIATHHDNRFEDLCIHPLLDEHKKPVMVTVEFPGRSLYLKLWKARAGHINMILLDADVEQNSPADRGVTYQLYGGDSENRIKQEICLGVGGVRALRALGIKPTAWHANEGHAAFILLERMREHVEQHGLSFDEALEAVAAATIFTSHTPVPAGHDVFSHDLFDRYMGHYAGRMGIGIERLHEIGRGDFGHGSGGFNQTALAIHCSSFQNGVAELHGDVTQRMCSSIWPNIPPEENPVTYVTNGVHLQTWISPEWVPAFDQHLGGRWRGQQIHTDFWKRISDIPPHLFWSIHQANKLRLLHHVKEVLCRQTARNSESSTLVQEMTSHFDQRTLVIGFARRFATYKRATLLLRDRAKLLEIVSNHKRPVIFLFAGKAHPQDKPGQELIRELHALSRHPDFIGHILMVEGYDMSLARYMTQGVDVWLNNPRRLMEASGTSGMKASMNGVPNLSILDGWWPEGFETDHGSNGWVIGNPLSLDDEEKLSDEQRDSDDAISLYHVLKDEVIPTYYDRNESAYSDRWVRICQRAMITCIPKFNTSRMVSEYTERFYLAASKRGQEFSDGDFSRARSLAAWKRRVRQSWPALHIAPVTVLPELCICTHGEEIQITVHLNLGQLEPKDVRVEVVLYRPTSEGDIRKYDQHELSHINDGLFGCNLQPDDTGNFSYRIRVYPVHEDLAHPQAMGLMSWL